jgi:hypothetical protein
MPSFGMLRHVALVRTDISDESNVFIIRVTRIGELGTTFRLEHPDNSVVPEHSIDQGHRIQFHNFSNLATKIRQMDRTVGGGGGALRLNSTPTISTERVALVSVNHGSLLSATLKLPRYDPGTLGDAMPCPKPLPCKQTHPPPLTPKRWNHTL